MATIKDTRKVQMSFTLPASLAVRIEQYAAAETEGNRSIALARMLRKLEQYEKGEYEVAGTVAQ